jgi:hypothetical protein
MTLPQPLAMAVPACDFPLNGRLGLVEITPPSPFFTTLAALVFETTCFPLEPSRFFLRAVEALSDLLRLLALDRGKHLSGFFFIL